MSAAGLTRRVHRGLGYTFATTVVSGLMQVCVLVVLSRLIEPQDYGLFAVVAAFGALTVGLVTGITERAFVIAQGEEHLRLAAASILTAALLVSLAAVSLAGLLSYFRFVSFSIDLAAIQLLSLVVASAGIVPRVLLRRAVEFKWISVASLMGQLIGSVLVTVSLAWFGWGVYALLLGTLAQQFMIALTLLLVIRPTWARPSLASFRAIAGPSRPLAITAALEVANGRLPTLIFGAMLGPALVGIFNRANAIVQLPLELLTSSMSKVLMSAFSEARDDRDRLIRGMRRLLQVTSLVICPVAGGIAGSHVNFVAVVLGNDWTAASAIVPWLAVATTAGMFAHLFGVLAEASHRLDEKMRAHRTSLLLLAGFVLAGSSIGLREAAIALALAALCDLYLLARIGSRIVVVSLTTFSRWAALGLAVGALNFLMCLLIERYVEMSAPIEFALQVLSCALVTSAAFLVTFRKLLMAQLADFKLARWV